MQDEHKMEKLKSYAEGQRRIDTFPSDMVNEAGLQHRAP